MIAQPPQFCRRGAGRELRAAVTQDVEGLCGGTHCRAQGAELEKAKFRPTWVKHCARTQNRLSVPSGHCAWQGGQHVKEPPEGRGRGEMVLSRAFGG